MKFKGPRYVFFLGLTVLLLIAVVAGVSLGSVSIPIDEIIRILLSRIPGLGSLADGISNGNVTIITAIRLPVVVMAVFVGAGLASSGASMQGLFRNPLVDPFIIGVSAGGAFGAILGGIITNDMPICVSRPIVITLSFVFALAAVFLAYIISKTGNKLSIANMLLAGVAMSAFLTALTQVVTYFFIENPKSVIFALMGSCANSSWEELAFVVPIVLVCTFGLVFFGRDLNAFSAGDEGAKRLGVDVERSKIVILALACLVTAISIPFCGVIAFVGLIIPHIIRMFIGPDHRLLIPGSALGGAFFLLLCDLMSRNVMSWIFDSPTQIPVGIVTGLIGGLFFVYLLGIRRWKA